MHDMGEWGQSSVYRPQTSGMTSERLVYLRYLRAVHDDAGFLLAQADSTVAPWEEVQRAVFEAEMFANYGVV